MLTGDRLWSGSVGYELRPVADSPEQRNRAGRVLAARTPPGVQVLVGPGIGPHVEHDPEFLREFARRLLFAADWLEHEITGAPVQGSVL